MRLKWIIWIKFKTKNVIIVVLRSRTIHKNVIYSPLLPSETQSHIMLMYKAQENTVDIKIIH